MNFSDALPFSGPPPALSPDQRWLASADKHHLYIRDAESLVVVGLFSCLDTPDAITWAPDSDHILCCLFKRATAQVFCVSDPAWAANINEGVAGLQAAQWSPCGAMVLCTSDFGLRLSVWSLVDQACQYLSGPKHPNSGLQFSPDGSQLVVLHRSNCKDWMGLYDTGSWRQVAHIPLATHDAADLAFSPDGACIAVWDSPLYGHLVAVYSSSGECLTTYSAYKESLGLKAVAWSPSGQLLALGSYDQEVRVLNHITWSPLATFAHPSVVRGPPSLVAYTEVEEDLGRRALAENLSTDRSARKTGGSSKSVGAGPRGPAAAQRQRPASRTSPPAKPGARESFAEFDEEETAAAGPATSSRYVVAELPVRLPVVRPMADKPNPKLGCGALSWSHDGAFIATRCDSVPTAVYIWETSRLELVSVLQHSRPVRQAEWDPNAHRLVICTGGTKLYMWSPEGASVVHIPLPRFRCSALAWHPESSSLLVSNRDSFCCAFLT